METMQRYLLFMIATPQVEETIVDWLLNRDDVSGYTSFPVRGHGSSAHSLSVAEQVAGRRAEVLFLVECESDTASALVHGLRRDFAGSGLHYWLTPVADSGRIE